MGLYKYRPFIRCRNSNFYETRQVHKSVLKQYLGTHIKINIGSDLSNEPQINHWIHGPWLAGCFTTVNIIMLIHNYMHFVGVTVCRHLGVCCVHVWLGIRDFVTSEPALSSYYLSFLLSFFLIVSSVSFSHVLTISCLTSHPLSALSFLYLNTLFWLNFFFSLSPLCSLPPSPFFTLYTLNSYPVFVSADRAECNFNMDTSSCAQSAGFSFTSWSPMDIQHMFKS